LGRDSPRALYLITDQAKNGRPQGTEDYYCEFRARERGCNCFPMQSRFGSRQFGGDGAKKQLGRGGGIHPCDKENVAKV